MLEDPPPNAESAPEWLLIALPFGFLVIFPLFWCAICLLLSRVGGWSRLARHYGTDEKPSGLKSTMQSAKINLVSYNNCLTVHVSEAGIYLSIMFLFRLGHQPVMIPWRDIHNVRKDKVWWFEATSLDVGEPKIASLKLGKDVYQKALDLIDTEQVG